MKAVHVLLFGSLAVNAALALSFVLDRNPAPASLPAEAFPTTRIAAPEPPGPETWQNLASDDLSELRDRLREAGMPPAVMRGILAARIRESFASQRRALEAGQADIPYWQSMTADPKAAAALRELNQREGKLLRELLGSDGRNEDPAYAAYLARQFGALAPEKVEQLREIMNDYNERRAALRPVRMGPMLPDEQQQMTALDRAMREEFATILTREEMESYELRSSNTAMMLRQQLAVLDVTEEEYKALFRLQQPFDEQYRAPGRNSPELMQARNQAQQQLTADIKVALGPERFAQYERAIDPNFRQTAQLAVRLDLPPESAEVAFDLQKRIQQSAVQLRSDQSLSPAAREQQIAGLLAEAETKLTAVLGEPGFAAYRENGMGGWMQMLRTRPADGKAAPGR
jgi:hypothetical protein